MPSTSAACSSAKASTISVSGAGTLCTPSQGREHHEVEGGAAGCSRGRSFQEVGDADERLVRINPCGVGAAQRALQLQRRTLPLLRPRKLPRLLLLIEWWHLIRGLGLIVAPRLHRSNVRRLARAVSALCAAALLLAGEGRQGG